ncbi:MAG: DUF5777 family beta-barrel protein [Cyclobacteriaceae bacterium]|nr:DUF5777 family beta-barrel protein [Cyclobacteriaceae bacterium]
MLNKITLLFTLLFSCSIANAQDNLMSLLDDDSNEKKEVTSVFKGTRVLLGHSTKLRKKNELELLISHRFGALNSGAYEYFGLDASSIRIGLEYGVTNNINVGWGRSSNDKTYDGFIKYKIISQSSGQGGMPISIAWFSNIAVKTSPQAKVDSTYEFKERLSYTHQLLVSRKFSSGTSIQLMPTFVYRNRPSDLTDQDQMFIIGIGGRQKLTKSLTLNFEYFHRINPVEENTEWYLAVNPAGQNGIEKDCFAIGFDIETGGHVFQIQFTNSILTNERGFLTETFDDFWSGDIHLGFNISRTFQF